MLDTTTTNGHSLISPSGATRWANCAGSVRFTMNEKQTTNSAAQRGTDIHQMGEGILNGVEYVEAQSVIRDNSSGDDVSSMFYANRDMLEEATAYAKYVKDLMIGPHSELFVESNVMILPDYDLSGHVDACVIDGTTLHVIDLKTGRGEVSAENNMQMQLYAIGLYEEHEMFYDIENIHLHIVQDNAMIHNTNDWELSLDDLMDFREWISERARLALQEDSVCTPSPSACQWCSHQAKCKALLDKTTEVITGEFDSLDDMADTDIATDFPETVSVEDMLNLLGHQKMITNLFKAYEQRLLDTMMAGEKVDGYKLVLGTKNKKWKNETEAFAKLKSWMPIAEFEDYAPRKLCTPTQAAKMIKGVGISARKANIFDQMWERPEGDVKIALSSSKSKEFVPVAEFDELDAPDFDDMEL